MKSNFNGINAKNLIILGLLSNMNIRTEAGPNFIRCLTPKQYDIVSNFLGNFVDNQVYCCHSDGCRPIGPRDSCLVAPTAQCHRVGNSKFCITQSWTSTQSNLPGKLCGGTLGNELIASSNSIGDCPSVDAVKNSLDAQRTTPTFSWLCCSQGSCTAPANVILNRDFANTGCDVNQHSMICFNDNKGWSCTGNVSADFHDISKPFGTCILQFSAPESIENPGNGNDGVHYPSESNSLAIPLLSLIFFINWIVSMFINFAIK